MELQILYDEKRVRETPGTWDEAGRGVDVHYLNVRLFKGVGKVTEGLRTEQYPVYLLTQDYTSYEGDPAVDRSPTVRNLKRAYVQGPDSKLIRKAVALSDGFGGQRSYDSR